MLSLLSQLSLVTLWHAYMCAQSCFSFETPWTAGPRGSCVHGIFQAWVLEWVAISYSRGSPQTSDETFISCIACIGRWIPYCWGTWEAQLFSFFLIYLFWLRWVLSCSSRDLCCSTWDLVPQPETMVTQTWYPAAISLKMNHVSLSLQGKQLFVDK